LQKRISFQSDAKISRKIFESCRLSEAFTKKKKREIALETGKGKIQQICDLIKQETIEPAQQQASEILENAHLQADKILEEAGAKVKEIEKKSEQQREQKEKSFQASLSLAAKQAIANLKQQIEGKLFHKNLQQEIAKAALDSNLVAKMIEKLVESLEGQDQDMQLLLPKAINKKELASHLAAKGLSSLAERAETLDDIKGGAQLKLVKDQLTLDMSDKALQDLLGSYVRKEFRAFFFES